MEYQKQPNSRFLSLPSELIEKIVIQACDESVEDIGRVKLSCKQHFMATKEEGFYKGIDILNISYNLPWIINKTMAYFFFACFRANNPSALYLKGVQEFFKNSKSSEGIAGIRLAAKAGCEAPIYTDTLLQIALLEGSCGKFVPNMTRDFAKKIRESLFRSEKRGWVQCVPDVIPEKNEHTYLRQLWACPCTIPNGWFPWDREECKGPTICDNCFWVREVGIFSKNIARTVNTWPDMCLW